MGMMLDIMRKLNLNLLDCVIAEVGKNNISYIVMSENTRKVLASGNERSMNYMSDSGSYTKYRDLPIAIYNGIVFGEVELVADVKRR